MNRAFAFRLGLAGHNGPGGRGLTFGSSPARLPGLTYNGPGAWKPSNPARALKAPAEPCSALLLAPGSPGLKAKESLWTRESMGVSRRSEGYMQQGQKPRLQGR